jgi:hypothetical protein
VTVAEYLEAKQRDPMPRPPQKPTAPKCQISMRSSAFGQPLTVACGATLPCARHNDAAYKITGDPYGIPVDRGTLA